MDLRDITMTRVLGILAVLTVLTWLWAIADSDIPRGIFFLTGVIGPVVLFILFLSSVVGNLSQGERSSTVSSAPTTTGPEGTEEASRS